MNGESGARTKDLRSYGYAPGRYTCRCQYCGNEFYGDKRAVACKSCAEKHASERRHTPPTSNEQSQLPPQSVALIRSTLEDMRRNGLKSGLPQEHAFTLLEEIERLRRVVKEHGDAIMLGGEIEGRLARERDSLLAAIGEHVTVRSEQYAQIQRLRTALRRIERTTSEYSTGEICRAALSGEPGSAVETAGEPAAWMTDDGRVVNAESKRTCRNSSLNSYMIPLYRRTKETSGYSQAYADQMREALLTIATSSLTPDRVRQFAHKGLLPPSGSSQKASGEPIPSQEWPDRQRPRCPKCQSADTSALSFDILECAACGHEFPRPAQEEGSPQ